MKTKFTPGPWIFSGHEAFKVFQLSKESTHISTPSQDERIGVEEKYANARLIAEAPSMCGLLEDILDNTFLSLSNNPGDEKLQKQVEKIQSIFSRINK